MIKVLAEVLHSNGGWGGGYNDYTPQFNILYKALLCVDPTIKMKNYSNKNE